MSEGRLMSLAANGVKSSLANDPGALLFLTCDFINVYVVYVVNSGVGSNQISVKAVDVEAHIKQHSDPPRCRCS